MLHKIRKNLKKIIIGSLFLVSFIISLIFMFLFNHCANTLNTQNIAETFRGDNDLYFTQVSAYFPLNYGIEQNDVYAFRETLEKAYVTSSVVASENGSLYIDAYSATAEVSISGSKTSTTVEAFGVGGNFFYFHPLSLRVGQYINESDIMHDRVVISEELAWKLFGSLDVAGMTVTISSMDFIVAGVIKTDTDFATTKLENIGLYMHYDILNTINETEISCYELVSAEPISNFTMSNLTDGFSEAIALTNTGRFSVLNIFSIMKNFATSRVSDTAIAYPYWENAARIVEGYCAIFLLLSLLFILAPATLAVVMAVKYAKIIKAKLGDIISKTWETLKDKIREKQRIKIEEKAKKW